LPGRDGEFDVLDLFNRPIAPRTGGVAVDRVLGKYVPAATTVDPSTPTARDGTPCDFPYVVIAIAERCADARAAPIGSG
jgi:hypothetical protein